MCRYGANNSAPRPESYLDGKVDLVTYPFLVV